MIKKVIFALFLLASTLALGEETQPLQAELIAEHQTIKPGQEFSLLLTLSLDQDWHAYWKNPGDAGMAPEISWSLPKGITVVKTEWPTPARFENEGAISFGYAEKVPFLITFQADSTLPEGDFDIQGSITWVICSKDTCLPGSSDIKIHIINNKESTLNEAHVKRFQDVKNALPQTLSSEWIQAKDEKLLISLPDDEIALNDAPLFFPERGTTSKNITLSKTTSGTEISIPKQKGLLVVGEKAYAVDYQEKDPESLSLTLALGFAFLGGILLNLMPCVLPVVSLKVMSFVKMSGNSRLELFKQGVSFTLGILVSFWALAALLITLQATGSAVGWGFQLQEPLFIGSLALVFTLLALNLFGVFEMGTKLASVAGEASYKAQKSGLSGSFFSGVFATAVATPCTGPFMGSALGFTLGKPPYIAIFVFTALGIGMALPYLLIGVFPSLIRFLPKPGAWMENFKQFLGFLMLFTVVWLLWVFAGQTSELALFALLVGLVVASCSAWVYGKFGSIANKKNIRVIGLVLAGVFMGLALSIGYYASGQVESHQTVSNSGWEPYSEERIAELRAKNVPILVDFTAKWCLICQVNHLALEDQVVVKKLEDKGVVKMKADWTRYDPVITRALEKHGRSGVPLYVLYSDAEEATILPQVLTKDNLISSLETNLK